MSVEFEIPDRLLEQLHMTKAELEQEVRLMTAARLYERGLASTGRAAEAVGLPRALLLSRLASFGVQLYDPEADDLESDLSHAACHL